MLRVCLASFFRAMVNRKKEKLSHEKGMETVEILNVIKIEFLAEFYAQVKKFDLITKILQFLKIKIRKSQ